MPVASLFELARQRLIKNIDMLAVSKLCAGQTYTARLLIKTLASILLLIRL